MATVTSHETLLPLHHGMIDAPSGRLREKLKPSRHLLCTLKPAGSFNACIFALSSAHQMTSFFQDTVPYLSTRVLLTRKAMYAFFIDAGFADTSV